MTFHSTDNGVRARPISPPAVVGQITDVYSGPDMGIYLFYSRISWLNASGPDASNGPRGTAWLLLLFDIFDLMSAGAGPTRFIDPELAALPGRA